MDVEALRHIVRQKGDRLPRLAALRRLFRQPGRSRPCVVCDRAISPSEAEYELTDDTGQYHVHPECFTAWMRVLEGDRPG
jgi:hypothetical protein